MNKRKSLPGYHMFIKACLDGIIDEIVNDSSKHTPKQKKDQQRGTSGKVPKGSKTFKLPNIAFEPHNSNLQLIKAAVNIWNRLSEKKKAYWMTKRHEGSCVSGIRRVFTNSKASTKLTKLKANREKGCDKSNRKAELKGTETRSRNPIRNESAKGNIKDFNNNSQKIQTTKQRRRKFKSNSEHSPRCPCMRSAGRKSKATLAGKSKQPKRNVQIFPDFPLQEMKLSRTKGSANSIRTPSKQKGLASPSTNDFKKACGNKRKRKISAKNSQVKTITDSKKFKENFGKNNRKNIKANVKLCLKKFCAKRPPGSPIDENIPVDRLENKSRKRAKRKYNSRVKISKKRRSLNNNCNKSTNNNHNNNNSSNFIHKEVYANVKSDFFYGSEARPEQCNRLSFPKYFRGREPRYPQGSEAR